MIRCNTHGVDGYVAYIKVKYRVVGSGDDYFEETTWYSPSLAGSVTILVEDISLLAYTEYEVQAVIKNDNEESLWSTSFTVRTLEDGKCLAYKCKIFAFCIIFIAIISDRITFIIENFEKLPNIFCVFRSFLFHIICSTPAGY